MTDIINPLATLIASFAGAWAAFKLQSVEKSREIDRSNIAAANRALLVMMQQANELKLYQKDHIDPQRHHPGRHIGIQATLPFDLDTLRFDFKSLDFLSSATEQQLLFELSVEERRYIEALKAINARSEMILTEVQPRLMAAGFNDSAEYTGAQFTSALGQPTYNKLQRLTDDVIYHVDRTNESICTMRDKFRAAALKRYPKEKFVNFEFVGESQPAP
ncbi:hypothetical protein ACFPN1_16245 [Lysobacter yangpyeongensis]|uniref:DUF4230 domain-containing protein n=1 Tax=Lysobacter yangpyeongensis TaxID=346182 RepID=A0ABW0SRL7_9GAMM